MSREKTIEKLLKQHATLVAVGPRVDGTRQVATKAYDSGYNAAIEDAARIADAEAQSYQIEADKLCGPNSRDYYAGKASVLEGIAEAVRQLKKEGE